MLPTVEAIQSACGRVHEVIARTSFGSCGTAVDVHGDDEVRDDALNDWSGDEIHNHDAVRVQGAH